MLSLKENFYETLKRGNPDAFVNSWEVIPQVWDPVFFFMSPVAPGGSAVTPLGVHLEWRADEPGVMPITTPDKLVVKDVSFNVHKGEIVGFSGLQGAGRTELMRAVYGADRYDSGEVIVKGKKMNIRTPEQGKKAGIALLTEDRKNQGLILGFDLTWNVSLTNLDRFMEKYIIIYIIERERK